MDNKPNIVISSLDAERLDNLLAGLSLRDFPGKQVLEEELLRAEVVEPERVPATVVTMNSTARFRIGDSADDLCLTLVYPKAAGNDAHTVSILAPVGSALLGLAVGDSIDWPKPGGGTLQLHMEELAYQPERAGDWYL